MNALADRVDVHSCRLLNLPKIPDARGNLTFIEEHHHIPFAIERAYWIYDVPGGEARDGHAFLHQEEFVVALSGSFDVVLNDGREPKTIALNRSYRGLYIPALIWRHLDNFSTNAVCLVLSSWPFKEEDYVRDFERYVRMRAGQAA
ncbi:MAG: FdtA/QdtA family cupin domain-containing protein [Lentisphaerota bacterium]